MKRLVLGKQLVIIFLMQVGLAFAQAPDVASKIIRIARFVF